MSDIVKEVYSTTDKLNFISNTDNLFRLLSRNESLTNSNHTSVNDKCKEEEEALLTSQATDVPPMEPHTYKKICNMIILIKVVEIIGVFLLLLFSNLGGIISNELFMGLALLGLFMPDIVLVITIIILIVNNKEIVKKFKDRMKEMKKDTDTSDSDGDKFKYLSDTNKYILTNTPNIFTN